MAGGSAKYLITDTEGLVCAGAVTPEERDFRVKQFQGREQFGALWLTTGADIYTVLAHGAVQGSYDTLDKAQAKIDSLARLGVLAHYERRSLNG